MDIQSVQLGILAAFLLGLRPGDVRDVMRVPPGRQFVEVPIVAEEVTYKSGTEAADVGYETETIELRRFRPGSRPGGDLWIGYGPKSGTLVVRE